jgi:hypothetical protein
MMLAQCGAPSCDWRATPAYKEALARGEPGLPLGCAVTYGQRHKESAPTEADASAALCKQSWQFGDVARYGSPFGRGVFGLMTLIREITHCLDIIVRPHLPQQSGQLGDVAGDGPCLIESQRLGATLFLTPGPGEIASLPRCQGLQISAA